MVRRAPVASFLVIAFGLGWPLLALVVLADHGVLRLTVPLPLVVLLVTLAVLVPAALGITGLTEGRAAVRVLVGRIARWRFGLGWWSLVVAAVPLGAVALGLAAGGRLTPAVAADQLAGDLAGVLSALVLIHLAEELVWTGFLQTRLVARFGVLRGAALTAPAFAAIHLPLVLLGAISPGAVATDVGGLLLLAVLLRVAIGLVLPATGGSVLGAAMLHAGFNAANNAGGLVDHLLAGVDRGLVAALALAVLGVALGTGRWVAARPLIRLSVPTTTITTSRRPS